MAEREVLWAIAGRWPNGRAFLYVDTAYLYVDTSHQRKEMIRRHCEQKGRDWATCRKAGDRVVKVIMTWKMPR